jgi:dihydropteroate synthase
VGSLATTVVAFMKDVDIIRVHDVKEHNEMLKSLSWML